MLTLGTFLSPILTVTTVLNTGETGDKHWLGLHLFSASSNIFGKTEAESFEQSPTTAAAATALFSSKFHHLQRERPHLGEVVHPQGLGRSLRGLHEEWDVGENEFYFFEFESKYEWRHNAQGWQGGKSGRRFWGFWVDQVRQITKFFVVKLFSFKSLVFSFFLTLYHLNTEHLNTGFIRTPAVWVSGIQMVKSHDLGDHLNTGHFGP